jgi:hypothetical protein
MLDFLDVMLDHLGEHRDLGVEVVIVRRHALYLGDQLLRTRVLDYRLVVHILVLGCLKKGGIEDLLLDDGVHGERLADTRSELLLFRLARFFKFREPVLDLPMIRLEQGDCVEA